MGHTNSTVNYKLPQFVGTDKPSWLGDVNGAFLAIDTAIAAAKTTADSAAGGVAGLQTTVGSHTTQIGTLTDTVTAQGGTLNSVTALIGNGTPTTTDQTIIGAINEINAKVSDYVEVVPGASDTWATVLGNLHTALTGHTVSTNARLVFTLSGNDNVLHLGAITSNGYTFERTLQNASGIYVQSLVVTGSPANTTASISNGGTFNRDDNTSAVATNVTSVRIYL